MIEERHLIDAKEQREGLERGGEGDERYKGEGSGGSEVPDLECCEKLEVKILELEIELERRRKARASRKQGLVEKLEELVEELDELERQRERVESVRRNLNF